MKKQKITYGVYNMVEWHALLRSGKATIDVHFKNGASSADGISPATFTTSDPLTQIMIENTDEFKSGKIKRVRVYALGGDVETESNASLSEEVAVPQSEEVTEPEADPSDTDEETTTEDMPEAPADGEKPKVEVSDIAAAKDYLADNFVVKRSTLRSMKNITDAAAENGIELIING